DWSSDVCSSDLPRGERLWRHGLTVGPVPPLFPARAPTRSAGGLAQASYACGMGMKDRIARAAGTRAVPAVASGYVRTVLDMAIDGVGTLKPVVETAGAKLAAHGGDVERAVAALVRSHTSLAGLQGFVTNLGGIALAAASVPANVVGVTIVQCHLVASIAHLRGY